VSRHLVRKLEELDRSLGALATAVAHGVTVALDAYFAGDEAAARRVIEDEVHVDRMEIDLEEACLLALALEQPVAADLRLVVAVLKINSDLERIGDLAVSVAEETVSLADRAHRVEPPMDLSTITRQVRWVLAESLQALVRRDEERAERVRIAEGEIEEATRSAQERLRSWMIERPEAVPRGLSILRVLRDLERIAAHAVNIAEDVLYLTRGEIQRHSRPPMLQ